MAAALALAAGHVSDNRPLSDACPVPVLDARQRAAALAYRDLRARFEAACRSARRGGAGLAMTEAAWFALKRRHAALLEAAGFDRFLLDRVCLDGEAPLRCEAERVGVALGRVSSCLWSAETEALQ